MVALMRRTENAGATHANSVAELAEQAVTAETINYKLDVLRRFFEQSQFKRSALPNGPKISSGGSLSPRGDWRAPSDAHAAVWLDELERNVPDSE